MLPVSDINVFYGALVVLGVAGCGVLYINYHTESRKQRYLKQITATLWNFIPDDGKSKVSEYYWQWRKLLLAGFMLASLIISVSVTTIHVVPALKMAGGFMGAWLVFLFGFWYLDILPKLNKNRDGDKSALVVNESLPSTSINNSLPASYDGPSLRANSGTDQRLPVSIITGYLGAGKTTLVKHILNNTQGHRVLVIENEIGDEGIDHELLLQHTKKENIILMNNGCICCTVRKDIVDTFHVLLESEEILAAIEWVVIETTGLADPAPLILSLYMDTLCKSKLRLDGVITVVDAVNVKYHMDISEFTENDTARPLPRGATAHPTNDTDTRGKSSKPKPQDNEVIKQIAYADRVIVNKMDLLTSSGTNGTTSDWSQLKQAILQINPAVSILPCTRGDIPLPQLLNINGFSALKSAELLLTADYCQPIMIQRLKQQQTLLNRSKQRKAASGSSSSASINAVDASDSKEAFNPKNFNMESIMVLRKQQMTVQTCSLVCDKALCLDAVNVWLFSLLQSRGQDVYRVKGILDIHDYPEQFVVQGVHMLFDGCKGNIWSDKQVRKSVLVFIGVGLDALSLQQEFSDCMHHVVQAQRKKNQ